MSNNEWIKDQVLRQTGIKAEVVIFDDDDENTLAPDVVVTAKSEGSTNQHCELDSNAIAWALSNALSAGVTWEVRVDGDGCGYMVSSQGYEPPIAASTQVQRNNAALRDRVRAAVQAGRIRLIRGVELTARELATTGRAPCGHRGEHVIGDYVKCLEGCEGAAVPQQIKRESTQKICKRHGYDYYAYKSQRFCTHCDKVLS